MIGVFDLQCNFAMQIHIAKLHCKYYNKTMEELIFEWDDEKEQKNIKKHKIDFSTAAHVFSDNCRIEKYDGKHSEDEDRYKVIGAINGYLMIIVVSYTMRKNDKVIRMISARKAEKEEREEYYGNY
jgi:uncharacterized DUF497 family protein